MHDIKWIRDNPAAFDSALARRGLPPVSDRLLELDRQRRAAITDSEKAQSERNQLSKRIGMAKRQGEDATELLQQAAGLEARVKEGGAAAERADAEIRAVLEMLPNLPAAEVPDGADETANKEIRRHLAAPNFPFQPRDHVAIGEGLGLMDFAVAAKLSGARFVVLKGALARLERALAQFMLDLHTQEHGYTEVDPPLLVKDSAVYGTSQLPKAAEDMFVTAGDAQSRRWLVPTAEVPLTNLVAEEILDESVLPLRYTAWTPCFRSEAGSAGRDTRGMIRQHQFPKVELVSIVAPEDSEAEHERLTAAAEEVLKRLELPYRVMLLSSGDMGFSARKTYDLEVWLPGQGAYREISSCSNCGDFQARRMAARCRKPGEKATRFVHTLNGSGLAVGRTLIAVLENYQQEDGSVIVPAALRPYMGSLERIAAPARKG